ncbi:MAG: hypothetical protein AB7K04_05790 [Pseudorhodoplanes sp.]
MPFKAILRPVLIVSLFCAATAMSHWPAAAQGRDSYIIMNPEPGEARPASPRRSVRTPAPAPRATQSRRRGSSTFSTIPTHRSVVTPLGVAPKTIPAPQASPPSNTPMPVPGFSAVPPPPSSLSGGTFQDKAAGCVHYGTSMGIGAGQIGAYTGSCINSR